MESSSTQELTLRELLQIFWSRRSLVLIAAAAGLLLAVCVCLVTARRYEAVSTIQIENQGADLLDIASYTEGHTGASDALSSGIDIQTQARVLQSDALALRTIKSLHLADTPEFRSGTPGSSRRRLFSFGHPPSFVDLATQREYAMLKTFHANLSVLPVSGTRLVEISYSSVDPKLAAAVVNQLAQELVDYSYEIRSSTNQAASQALSKQLTELRQHSAALQLKVAQMQRESGLYSTGSTDASGRQQAYSAILDRFQRASVTLSEAEQNRILKAAIYQVAKTGNAESLSGLSGNTGIGSASPAMANSLTTIQNLRTQEAGAQEQLDELRVRFGHGYPKVAEREAEVQSLQAAIQQETQRVARRAESDFTVATETWQNARRSYDDLKGQADALNDKAIQYLIARQEADDSRSLYEDLSKHLEQAGVLGALKSSTITVLDQALIPLRPKKPNVPIYLAAGTALGAVLALLYILLSYALDDHVRSLSAIESGPLPVARILPRSSGSAWSEIVAHPDSPYSEMMRNLRSVLTLPVEDQTPRTLLITSAINGEGKSSCSLNLAASLVRPGKRVLLIEADMRRPSLHRRLKLNTVPTLCQMLADGSLPSFAIAQSDLPNLFLLPAGVPQSNPAELLESDAMHALLVRFRAGFDMVVIDAPPLLSVLDARALIKSVDVIVQVARYGVTTENTFARASRLLASEARGRSYCVLNGVDIHSAVYKSFTGNADSAASYHERERGYQAL